MGRMIDADALIAQMESDAEQMEDQIAKMFTYAAINDVKRAPTIEQRKTGTCDECKNKDRFDYETPCKKCIRIASKGRDGDYFEPLEGEEHG